LSITVSKQDGEKTAECTFISQSLNHRLAEWHAMAAPWNVSDTNPMPRADATTYHTIEDKRM